MADRPKVSVIIPTHQRSGALRRALRSLASQTADADGYETIVSIDASTDGTLEMLEAFDAPYALSWVAADKRGRAAACNAALAAAGGEVVIVLDDDMEAVEGFVELPSAPSPGRVPPLRAGRRPGRAERRPARRAARYVKEKFDLHLARLEDPEHLNLPRSFYTGNASLRAEVLREVGGFDESFAAYGNEDVELSLRLRAAGVELRFDPEALARQEYDKDLRGLQRDTLRERPHGGDAGAETPRDLREAAARRAARQLPPMAGGARRAARPHAPPGVHGHRILRADGACSSASASGASRSSIARPSTTLSGPEPTPSCAMQTTTASSPGSPPSCAVARSIFFYTDSRELGGAENSLFMLIGGARSRPLAADPGPRRGSGSGGAGRAGRRARRAGPCTSRRCRWGWPARDACPASRDAPRGAPRRLPRVPELAPGREVRARRGGARSGSGGGRHRAADPGVRAERPTLAQLRVLSRGIGRYIAVSRDIADDAGRALPPARGQDRGRLQRRRDRSLRDPLGG